MNTPPKRDAMVSIAPDGRVAILSSDDGVFACLANSTLRVSGTKARSLRPTSTCMSSGRSARRRSGACSWPGRRPQARQRRLLASQGDVDEAAVRAISQTAGTALGLPVTQVDRMYRGWQAWEEGDAGPGALLLGPPARE